MFPSQPWHTAENGLKLYLIRDADGKKIKQYVLIEYRSYTQWTPDGDETEFEWRWRDQFSDEWGGPYETREEAEVAARVFVADEMGELNK